MAEKINIAKKMIRKARTSIAYLKKWTLKWVDTPHAALALFLLAFAESSFFPIPPDALLIAMLLVSAKKWSRYALIATVGSVLGGVVGYMIGLGFYEAFGQKIVDFYNLENVTRTIGAKYESNAFLAVFSAAFTPIPYKVITISAGLFKIPIFTLIIASLIGRGLRFFMVAYLFKLFGRQVNEFVYKHFNILSLAFVAILILGFAAIKFLI